jgi:hypothetical protein
MNRPKAKTGDLNMLNVTKAVVWFSAFSIWLMVSAGIAAAEDSMGGDGWRFGAELYFWGASIGGNSATGADVDIGLGDILDNLEMAFMGTLAMSKGKWSMAADIIYLNVEDSGAIAPGLEAKVALANWVVTPVVGYTVAGSDKARLDLLGGARYLYLKADLSVDAQNLRTDDSGSNWDAVIGARGNVDLATNFYLFGYLDIGTGESDLTWQAFGGAGYRFKWFDLVAAYRYLRWDFDDNRALDNLSIHGPAAGIRFIF